MLTLQEVHVKGYEGPPCDDNSPFTQEFEAMLYQAKSEGIVTFAGSGDDADCAKISFPACLSSAEEVAAVYDGTYPGYFPGWCQDLAPQPHQVVCVSDRVPVYCHMLGAPGYKITAGGTVDGIGPSAATAHCSGVAALMIEKGGCDITPWAIADIMRWTGYQAFYAGVWCPESAVPYSIDALSAIGAMVAICDVLGHPACGTGVNLNDWEIFFGCMRGPGVPLLPGLCDCVDYPEALREERDGDVDLRDFAAFQRDFTGWFEGACCHVDGSCTEVTPPDCYTSEGVYQGDGTSCAAIQCPLPNWGACCDVATQTCAESTEEDCVWGGGFYMGGGTDCASASCPTARYRNVIDPLTAYASSGPGLKLADDITLDGAGPYALAYYDLGVYGGGGGSFDVTVGLYTDCPGTGGTLIPGTEFTFTDNPDYGSPVFLQAVVNPPVPIPNSFWMVATFSTPESGWFRAEQAEIGYTANVFGRNDPPWVCNYWFGGNPYAGFWANLRCVPPSGRHAGGEPKTSRKRFHQENVPVSQQSGARPQTRR